MTAILALPHEFAPTGFYATMRFIGIEMAHGRCRHEVAEEVVREMAPFIAKNMRGDCSAYLLYVAAQWFTQERSRLEASYGQRRARLGR